MVDKSDKIKEEEQLAEKLVFGDTEMLRSLVLLIGLMPDKRVVIPMGMLKQVSKDPMNMLKTEYSEQYDAYLISIKTKKKRGKVKSKVVTPSRKLILPHN